MLPILNGFLADDSGRAVVDVSGPQVGFEAGRRD
jgi:hypothetical protein